tara:strand:+ start:30968 stop:34774 length:3807 start_codon:yes stop_codon:yes gene_type:complete
MPTVQIGKYKRPGIYIEEFDSSVIETSAITGLQVMIMGSSKKGPVNTPIVLNSQIDLQRIFGDLDRTLESKGSYFHRTISKLLENTPVVAINLLNTDDELDQLEYKSLSCSSGFANDVKRDGSYRRFFDTSTFWKKDRDAFLALSAENPLDSQRVMHFTNMADREITVFVVKADSTTGYNKTLLEWYGSVNKVPFYVDPKDYASDYMVDVVVIDGNWTNYSNLSVDPRWSRYFNTSGLIKGELFNFANDSAINTLYIWRNLSLIPYFRDLNGANIFIENKINERTNRTGLYCAFDIDNVETDYRNGLLDLLGNSLITNNSAESIDFLSYNEDVNEILDYSSTSLDTPGNVNQLTYTSYYQGGGSTDREALYAEGYVSGLVGPGATSSDSTGGTVSGVGYGTASFVYTVATTGYSVIGGSTVSLTSTTFDFIPEDFTSSSTVVGTTQSFTEVFFIDSDGGIKRAPSNSQLTTGVVLGYADILIAHDALRVKYFDTIDYTPVSVDDNGFVYFIDGTDITATIDGTQDGITYEFLGTTGTTDINDYVTYRRWRVYNQMAGILNNTNSNRATILIDAGTPSNGTTWKYSIDDLTVDITSTSVANNTIKISGFGAAGLTGSILKSEGLVLHTTDNELTFLSPSNGLLTTNDSQGATQGVVGVWSTLYQDYIDGQINTGDKFYENLIDGADNTIESSGLSWIKFLDVNGNDYIVSDLEINFNTNDVVIVPEATLNTGTFTTTNPTPIDIGASGSFGGLTAGYAYIVSEDTVAETVINPTKVWNTSETHYLRFYKVGDVLTISFMDDSLSTPSITYNSTLDIVTQDSNFRQTVEVEMPTGYVRPSNVVLVSGTRYSEIKIGDFLEMLVDETALELGEVPRRMTRILSKKTYAGDSSLLELGCDSSIKLYDYDGDLQTFRFTEIDDYVSTYKGISLFGFRVRPDSMPDGTDDRIDDILDIIGKGTPLYNAVVDKDIIDFRYLVDSYGLGLTSLSKQTLADICGKRLDTFGILNMPSMKQFRKSTSPSFVDSEGRLRTDYIALGGDPESTPAFNYSLAEGDGISCVGYFSPYVIVNDNGRPREIPPSAWVATTFLRKHNSAITSVTPWTIAAGITDGQVTGIAGLEYSFNGVDIENLNGMSVNPIISKRNRGRVIETENTAQTLVTSALSFIHVREVLIEIERDLSDMLLQFQWKYNTPDIRAEIKLRADAICEDYVNRNGLYNFFNKMDSENNTSEIIDNQMGVLDTYVEPIKGMGIIVNNITILKTGGVNSGGFI